MAPTRRVFKRISTPRFIRMLLGEAGQALGQLGQDEVAGVQEDDLDLVRDRCCRKLRATARTKSFSSATASTPEKPPPATTKVRRRLADVGVRLDVGLLEGVDRRGCAG